MMPPHVPHVPHERSTNLKNSGHQRSARWGTCPYCARPQATMHRPSPVMDHHFRPASRQKTCSEGSERQRQQKANVVIY